jgi:hypothetical protein
MRCESICESCDQSISSFVNAARPGAHDTSSTRHAKARSQPKQNALFPKREKEGATWRRGSRSSRREGCERCIPWAGLLAPGRRESPHDKPLHLPTRSSGSGLSKEAHPVTVARPHRSCTGFPGAQCVFCAPPRESAYSVVRWSIAPPAVARQCIRPIDPPDKRAEGEMPIDVQLTPLDVHSQTVSIYGDLEYLWDSARAAARPCPRLCLLLGYGRLVCAYPQSSHAVRERRGQ